MVLEYSGDVPLSPQPLKSPSRSLKTWVIIGHFFELVLLAIQNYSDIKPPRIQSHNQDCWSLVLYWETIESDILSEAPAGPSNVNGKCVAIRLINGYDFSVAVVAKWDRAKSAGKSWHVIYHGQSMEEINTLSRWDQKKTDFQFMWCNSILQKTSGSSFNSILKASLILSSHTFVPASVFKHRLLGEYAVVPVRVVVPARTPIPTSIHREFLFLLTTVEERDVNK